MKPFPVLQDLSETVSTYLYSDQRSGAIRGNKQKWQNCCLVKSVTKIEAKCGTPFTTVLGEFDATADSFQYFVERGEQLPLDQWAIDHQCELKKKKVRETHMLL